MKIRLQILLMSVILVSGWPISSMEREEFPVVDIVFPTDSITLESSDEHQFIVPQHIIDEFQTIANLIEDAGSEAPMPLPNVDSKTLQTMIQLAQQLYELKEVDNALPKNEKIFMPRAYQIKANPILEQLSNEQLVDTIMAANYLDNETMVNAVAAVIADRLSARLVKERSSLVTLIAMLKGSGVNDKQKLSLIKVIKERKSDSIKIMNLIFQFLPLELKHRIAWYLTLREDGVTQEYSIADYIKDHGQPAVQNNTLNLRNKKLTSLFGLQRIKGLRALQRINLGYNKLRSIDPGTFKGLVALQSLDLDNNNLSSIDPGTFKGLVALQELWLTGNNLSSIDPGTFKGLVALQSLRLSSNNLSNIDPGTFKGLVALQWLELHSNKLSNIDPDTFKELVALQWLSLGRNELSNIDPDTFKGLVALQELRLYSNKLRSIDPDTFKGLVALQRLDLDNNNLSSIDPGTFKGLVALQELDLSYNNLSRKQKEKIKAEVKKVAPNAEIYF